MSTIATTILQREGVMAPIRVTRTGIIILFVAGVLLLYAVYSFHLAFWHRATDGPTAVNMKELLSVSIDLARRAGDTVRRFREEAEGLGEKVKSKTKEGADEIVTNGDRESHRILWYGLAKAFPGVKVWTDFR